MDDMLYVKYYKQAVQGGREQRKKAVECSVYCIRASSKFTLQDTRKIEESALHLSRPFWRPSGGQML